MKKNIKLIAFDLDGTLLDSQKRLSPRNESALQECVRRGIYLVPCTGRIWAGVPDFIREMPGVRYAITGNGAVLEDVVEHRVLDEKKLSWEKALEILKLGRDAGVMYDAYVDGQGYGETHFMNDLNSYGIEPAIQKMMWLTRKPVPDVLEVVGRLRKPVEKVNYFFRDFELRLRMKEMLLARGDVAVSASYTNNLEINELGATKGEALLRLASYLGLDPGETMGFGDGENDLTLMRYAGIGVAMANGMETVKAQADYVTETNDEDGVAVALSRLAGIE